jgi:hypothetical protein
VARAMTQEAVAGANIGREGREGRNAIEPKAKVVGGGLGNMFQPLKNGNMFQPQLSPKLKPLKNTIVPKVFSCRTCTHFLTFSPSRSRLRALAQLFANMRSALECANVRATSMFVCVCLFVSV